MFGPEPLELMEFALLTYSLDGPGRFIIYVVTEDRAARAQIRCAAKSMTRHVTSVPGSSWPLSEPALTPAIIVLLPSFRISMSLGQIHGQDQLKPFVA